MIDMYSVYRFCFKVYCGQNAPLSIGEIGYTIRVMNESPFVVPIAENSQPVPQSGPVVSLRRIFFILSILFFLGILIFLVYYNGKSIYVNGL